MNNHYLTAMLLGCLWMPLGGNAQTCSIGSASTPTGDFTFTGVGTVTHNTTGLVWKRCLEGQVLTDSNNTSANYADDTCTGTVSPFTWGAALAQAQTVNAGNFGGFNDWRVPSLKELKSIMEYCQAGGTPTADINVEVFPASTYSLVWSSSPVVNDTATTPATTLSWVANFSNGSDDGKGRSDTYPVRLVRGGL